MQDLIKTLLEPLVTNLSDVKIEESKENGNIRFTILVPKDDIAKVIGKEGRMVRSIKNLVKIRAIKENVFASVEVVEK